MRKGMTILELLAVLGGLALLVVILVPVLAIARKRSGYTSEGTMLSSLSKSFMVYGEGNKGYFPGLTATGDYISTPFQGPRYGAMPNAGNEAEEKSGEGCTVATGMNLALALLLEEDAVAPKQLISGSLIEETGQTSSGLVAIQEVLPDIVAGSAVHPTGIGQPPVGEVRSNHCSYAMLAYGRSSLKPEWKNNQNQQACIVASRMIFGGKPAKPGKFSSLVTEFGSGKWEGSVVRGDTSVGREKFQSGEMVADTPFRNLKYGEIIVSPQSETSSVVGIFGRSNDMDNFDAMPETGVLGSPND